MKAIISDKNEITKGTLMVELDLLGQAFSFKPGQFFLLRLINAPYNDSKGIQRYFSIVNSPNEKGVIIFATRISASAFKQSLNELPVGTEVDIDNIAGNFTLPEDKSRQLVFIAGGIGITPFMSMLRFVKEEKLDYEYKITLLYSNRDAESTAFFDELQGISKRNRNIKVVFMITQDANWKGESRRINAQSIKDYVPEPSSSTYMIAGPPPMVSAVVEALKAAGVTSENIITENFAGY
jgi:ferredoxin-NADP reductase